MANSGAAESDATGGGASVRVDESSTDGERGFILAHADGSPAALTEAARDRTAALIATQRSSADDRAAGGAYSIDDVVRLLGGDHTKVEALRRQGVLVGGQDGNGEPYFPRWQFTTAGGPLPWLREIVYALPDDYDVHSITSFMIAPAEELNGRTPQQWIAAAGDPDAVLDLAYRRRRI